MSENKPDVDAIIEVDVQNTISALTTDDNNSEKERVDLFSSVTVQEQIELKRIDMEALNSEADRRLKGKNAKAERKLRGTNASRSYVFSFCWASFIALTVILKGFGSKIGFKLSTPEFLSVIGALSATILTYYGIVVRSIFPHQSKENKEQ